MHNRCGIYEIKCQSNGRSYIGSSTELPRRWRVHRWSLENGRHVNRRLQAAWNKYGSEAFKFSVLVLCDPEFRLFYEQRIIDALGVAEHGFNLAKSVSSPMLGRKVSDDVKARISQAGKGRVHSQQTRARMKAAAQLRSAAVSAQMVEMWKTRSQEVIDKIAASNTGKKRDATAIANISRGNAKKWQRTEYREARLISLVRAREAAFTPESRAKMSAAMTKRMSDPTEKEKIAAVHRGRKNSPETIAKMRASALERERKKRLGKAPTDE